MKEIPAPAADDNDNSRLEAEVLTREDWACAGLHLVRDGDPFADILKRPSLSEIHFAPARPAPPPAPRPRRVRITEPPPRFINRAQAAAAVSVGTGTFDKMVRDGWMPQPIRYGRRRLWDRQQIEMACSKHSGVSTSPAEEPNAWDEVLQ